jgi:hypothetical protein
MAKKASDKPLAPAEEALKQRKKQARQEAKLILAIEEANKDLKKAQKKQVKAQALLEAESAHVQTLEARLAELRTPTPEPAIETPPPGIELEHQQEPSELDSGIDSSDRKQSASPVQEDQGEIALLTDQAMVLPQVEGGKGTPSSSSSETRTSTSNDTEPTPSIVEEATVPEVMVLTNEVTEGPEALVGQDDEIATATEPAPTPTAQRKAPAHKTATTRKPTVTKRPTSPSTATKRPASRSQSTSQPRSDAE